MVIVTYMENTLFGKVPNTEVYGNWDDVFKRLEVIVLSPSVTEIVAKVTEDKK